MTRRRKSHTARLTAEQRRRRYFLRRATAAVLAVLLLAAIFAGDRIGLFGTVFAPQGPDYARYDDKTFHVSHVVDGDTLDIDVPDGKKPYTRIRLWGVDTPETKDPRKPVQHFGPEAAEFTRRTCEDRTVRLDLVPGHTRGKYGRLLAYVYFQDGNMLNRELVRQGFAYADPRFDHPLRDEFRRLEARAAPKSEACGKTSAEKTCPTTSTRTS